MEKKEYLYKILVIGDNAVGKSSIVRRYVHNFFTERYKATIGVDFAMKVLNWGENTIVRLQLWDIAGQEMTRQLNRVFYNEASGCITVYDVTRPSTFKAVADWKKEIDEKVQLPNGQPIPCILFANKCDVIDDGDDTIDTPPQITKDVMDEYSEKFGFVDWFLTSAKENINLEIGIRKLVSKILENHSRLDVEKPIKRAENNIQLKGTPNTKQEKTNKGGCC